MRDDLADRDSTIAISSVTGQSTPTSIRAPVDDVCR